MTELLSDPTTWEIIWMIGFLVAYLGTKGSVDDYFERQNNGK